MMTQEYMNSISEAVDSSVFLDESTKKHCERVMYYAEILGRSLGYMDIDILKSAAYFHDIGKIKIPFEILNKASKLTDEEYSIIKKHPLVGMEFLDEIEVEEIQHAALYHHKRIDGTGYPYGLLGDQIPFVAKIVAIADVYEALTSTRSYHDAMRHDEAIQLMKSDKGAFEPRYLFCFIKSFEYDKLV